MKPAILVLCAIFSASTAYAESEKSARLSELDSETGYRTVIARVWPDLEFGFYHFSGDWLIGALEDFDNHRILLFHPARSDGHLKLTRNGKAVADPPGTMASLPIRGDDVQDDDTPGEYPIGLWIELAATDRLEIDIRTESPAKAEFRATYDPDNGWQTSSSSKVMDQNRKEPADAYEIMRGSLLQRTVDVLGEKEECVVRMNSRECRGMDVIIRKSPKRIPKDVTPLELILTYRILLGSGRNHEEIEAAFLQQNLRLYLDACRGAQMVPFVIFRVTSKTQDEIFRAALQPSCAEMLRHIYLEIED